MRRALDPDAWHNDEKGFLREGAVLAVVIVTDELDCSFNESAHPDVFDPSGDKEYWAVDPDSGTKRTSSSICWNAGVDCDGPDSDGEYDNCKSTSSPLIDVDAYADLLNDMIDDGKDVVMLGILGVPEVTERDNEPPYASTKGGVNDVVYREWEDGVYPDGDILPGHSKGEMEFRYGVGPGCTGKNSNGEYTGQAVPPVRIREVCESLDRPDEDRVRCCIESICDDDFSDALNCLTGLIEGTLPPVL